MVTATAETMAAHREDMSLHDTGKETLIKYYIKKRQD